MRGAGTHTGKNERKICRLGVATNGLGKGEVVSSILTGSTMKSPLSPLGATRFICQATTPLGSRSIGTRPTSARSMETYIARRDACFVNGRVSTEVFEFWVIGMDASAHR